MVFSTRRFKVSAWLESATMMETCKVGSTSTSSARSASSALMRRPAMAQRMPLAASHCARYLAASCPVKPVAPNRTRS